MPPAMSMEPLIPLPNESGVPQHDDKDDIFATLFSPATPRASPTLHATTTDDRDVERIRPRLSHNRTSSIDSDFGSFVSVPSAEDPLHQLSESAGEAFPQPPSFDFFDRFTEEAKVATEKNKQGILEELLRHEEDPFYFLQSGRSPCESRLSLAPHTLANPGTSETTPHFHSEKDIPPVLVSLTPDDAPSPTNPLDNPFRQTPSPYSFAAEDALEPAGGSFASFTSAAQSIPQPMLRPSSGLLHELLTHEDDPMYFHSAGSARSSRTPTPQPQERKSRNPTRESVQTDPYLTHAPGLPGRSPSLPPSPNRMSTPEVQRAQSFFMPTSFTGSSFPTKWVSSLLSRPTPPLSPSPVIRASLDYPITHGRAATIPGDAAISHGTPFAAQPFVPPSGAPGFAGDRTWNKGFEFDKENVERASVRLVGRKESTTAVLTGSVADKVRSGCSVVSFASDDASCEASATPSSSEKAIEVMESTLQSRPGWHLPHHPLYQMRGLHRRRTGCPARFQRSIVWCMDGRGYTHVQRSLLRKRRIVRLCVATVVSID